VTPETSKHNKKNKQIASGCLTNRKKKKTTPKMTKSEEKLDLKSYTHHPNHDDDDV
jgi:hypothetical protein